MTQDTPSKPTAHKRAFKSPAPYLRCERCCMRRSLCLCEVITKLDLPTRLVVLIHHRELNLTSHTAKLVPVALLNSEVRVRGQKDQPMSDEGLVTADRQALFLFPSLDAQVLTPELASSFGKPLTLIVPDGSWRQAKRVGRRVPALADVPHVKLPVGALSTYRLRREPNAESVSTFEAIARALGILEGAAVQERLEYLFDVMVERLLWSKGALPKSESRFPIPQAAIDESFIAGCRSRLVKDPVD